VALKDILVVLDESRPSEIRLALAVSLAQRHRARVVGLCPHALLGRPGRSGEPHMYPSPLGLQGLADITAATAAPAPAGGADENSPGERAERIGEAFREALHQHGLDGSYETAVGAPSAAVLRHTRTADLLVLGQPAPEDPQAALARHMIEDALMMGGRPLLLVPYAGTFTTVGTNVLLGWSETREAARAARDVLGLMEPGGKLTVLTVRQGAPPEGRTELPGAAIARHLARHGIETQAKEEVAEATTPPSFVVRPVTTEADVLLNCASDMGADLLAVGGYGHSRARELVLGGVTRQLLNTMTLPVLMSH
jgi:nucleotide-binding universal stress UspA family protein